MFESFYPTQYLDSTYKIDFEELYKSGVRGVLFDIDNTLVPHGAPADERAKQLFVRLKELGIGVCLISNNQLGRVKGFADSVGAAYIENAHKPSVKGYQAAMERIGCTTENTVFVGDQLFTDIYGANRTGIPTILVKPIHPKEEIQIVLKRYLEKIVLFFYMRKVGK
ncbi:MAG: YqeG family HAD IIIA-type phosphatase [Lachnospiraceae bacterium]|nr:YqeG family HAD IIIA-type phosphatase [Lachnospiraceae bacterium]